MTTNDTPCGLAPPHDLPPGQCRSSGAPEDESLETLLPEAARQLLHKLRARQSVLERENTELRAAQVELTAAYTRERELEDALQIAQARLQALWGVAAVADADVKTLADHILATLTTMTDSPYGFYGFINADESVMTIHAWSGEAMQGCTIGDKPTDFPIADAGVWGEAIRRRAPLILNDYAASHPAKKGLPAGHVPLSRLLVVPFFARGRIVAVAAVANRPTPYTQDDVTQITAFLGSIQAIVDNKRAEAALRASEEKYRIVADFTHDWECWRAPDGSYRYVSPSCERITGYRAEEFLADAALLERIVHPDDRALFASHQEQLPLDGGEHSLDFRILTRDGETRWLAHRCQSIYGREGEYLGCRSSHRDITQRKQVEAALQTSESRFRSLIGSLDDVIYTLDREQRHTGVFGHWVERVGLTPDFFLGRSSREIFGPEAAVHEAANARALAGEHVVYEWATPGVDGPRHYQTALAPIHNEGGAVIGVAGVGREITDRKQAEESLRESEERYRQLVELSPDLIAIHQQGRIVFINPAGVRLLGASGADEILGHSVLDFLPPERQELSRERVQRLMVEGKSPIYEQKLRRLDGTERDVEVVGTRFDSQGQPAVQVVIRDVTQRKQAEEALRASEARYRELFEHISSGVAVYQVVDDGKDFIFVDFNRAGERIDHDQRERLLGQSIFKVRPGAEKFGLIAVFRRVWQTGEPAYHPVTLYADEHLTGWYENYVYKLPSGEIVAVFDNITERKQAEAQIEQALAERDALLRELFHRINNNMQVVLSMLQLQAGTLRDPEGRAAFVATQNRIRAMALVHQMLYSAQDLSSVNLRQYVTALSEWLFSTHHIGSDQVQLELDVEEIVVLFDIAIPCGFVLNELIANVLEHAFPADRAGKLHIQLRRTAADELLLCVTDDGVGVPPGFDFRAAETLGLQIVFFTVEYQLQGRVEFTVENGVTCRVWLKDAIYTRRV